MRNLLARKAGTPRSIFGAVPDTIIIFAWLPLFLLWHMAAGSRAGGFFSPQQGVALALLISFIHQPLTFGLVYGDRSRIALHRRLFTWGPVIAVGAAAVLAFGGFWIVVPLGALWNLQHTLQQRYGVMRIYSGRAGYGSARLDRALCYAPMAVVLLALAASPRLEDLVRQSGIDSRNAGGVELLTVLHPVALSLLAVSAMVSLGVVVLLVRQERQAGGKANPAKWLYQGSSLALVASMVVDPTAGFIAYVSAHAVEYAVVVERTAFRRYASDDAGSSFLARVARTTSGRIGYFAAIVLAAVALKAAVHGSALNTLLFAVGGLHFTYDAVIWKLRRPAVARDFRLARPAVEPAPA